MDAKQGCNLNMFVGGFGACSNNPTQSSYFRSKIADMFWLQEVSVLSPQCGISLGDALATQHVQRAFGSLFSDMIGENENSESCHVLFFRFF